jgi:hypothetical protein
LPTALIFYTQLQQAKRVGWNSLSYRSIHTTISNSILK